MLLPALKLAPQISIVPGAHPVNVRMSQDSQPRLVRDALAADAIVAVVPEHTAVLVELQKVAHRLERFRGAQSDPTYTKLNDAASRFEHNGEVHVETTLPSATALLDHYVYNLFGGLHQLAEFSRLIVCVVAAPRLGR